MFTQFKKMVKDCLTQNDGQSYDFPRVLTVAIASTGFPTFLGLAVYSVYAAPEHHFDMIAFGAGFGAILGGLAAAAGGVAFKQKTDN